MSDAQQIAELLAEHINHYFAEDLKPGRGEQKKRLAEVIAKHHGLREAVEELVDHCFRGGGACSPPSREPTECNYLAASVLAALKGKA